MNRNKLILSVFSIAIVAGGAFMLNKEDLVKNVKRTYHSKDAVLSSEYQKSWRGAQEYYELMHKNVNTGVIEPADYAAALQKAKLMSQAKAGGFTFVEEGPDNVGGRTRGIIVDVNNDNIVYAGGVDGGVFKSVNAGNNWVRLDSWDDPSFGIGTVSVSSIVSTKNGTIYVGTGGSLFERNSLTTENSANQSGNGIWYTTDAGTTWTQLAGTAGMDINKIFADPSQNDAIYIVGQSMGLKKCVNKGTLTQVGSMSSSLNMGDVKVSGDGQVIICGAASGVAYRTYLSTDGGNNFTDLSANSQVPGAGIKRMEYAISYEKNSNNKYSLWVTQANGAYMMGGVYHSEDNGVTWYQIAPASTYTSSSTGPWAPCVSAAGQCDYDMVIDAVKGNPNQCVLGAIDLYRWTRTPGSDPSNGQWEQITNWSYPKQHPRYVHADNHRITWNSQGRMYVGNDGGIQMSVDNSLDIFVDANRGYNVTQFYGIAYGPDWAVMGGAQDNGTNYNDHSGVYSAKEFAQVLGGDGFECEISFMNNEAIIGSVYNSSISRSEDKGRNWSAFTAPCGSAVAGQSCGSFYTAMRLFEDPNDLDTKDSILFQADSNMFVGDTVIYYSQTFNMPLKAVLTKDLKVIYDTVIPLNDSVLPNYDTIPAGVPYLYNERPYMTYDTLTLYSDSIILGDGYVIGYYDSVSMSTVMIGLQADSAIVPGLTYSMGDIILYNGVPHNEAYLPDPKQSLFVTTGQSGMYITRDALRYSIGSPEWWQLFPYGTGFMSSFGHSYEFSKDGNVLWLGSETFSTSELVRVMGLDSAYSAEAMDYSNIPNDSIKSLTTGDTITSNYGAIDYSADNYVYMDGTPVEYKLGIKRINVSGMSGVISDISVDATNPDRVIVVTGGTGTNHVFYSSNATSATPTFTAIDGTGTTGLPDMPIFGVDFIRNPNGDDIVLVGTEYGVYSTLNPGGASHPWTAHNEEIGLVPVFDVRQQWRDWNDGVYNPFAVYLGTHGKGLWRSDDVLSVDEIVKDENKEEVSSLTVYPNPLNESGNVSFELGSNSDVEIKIFDLTGKLVKQKMFNNMSAGTQTISFNTSSLPNGTYLIIVGTEGKKQVEKFVKY